MAKSKLINFKVEPEIKADFEKACIENYTTPSAELYKFIRQYINRNKSKKVLLSDLRQ